MSCAVRLLGAACALIGFAFFAPVLAQARDAQAHLVAGLQVQRRLLAKADAGRRAGADEVAAS